MCFFFSPYQRLGNESRRARSLPEHPDERHYVLCKVLKNGGFVPLPASSAAYFKLAKKEELRIDAFENMSEWFSSTNIFHILFFRGYPFSPRKTNLVFWQAGCQFRQRTSLLEWSSHWTVSNYPKQLQLYDLLCLPDGRPHGNQGKKNNIWH